MLAADEGEVGGNQYTEPSKPIGWQQSCKLYHESAREGSILELEAPQVSVWEFCSRHAKQADPGSLSGCFSGGAG